MADRARIPLGDRPVAVVRDGDAHRARVGWWRTNEPSFGVSVRGPFGKVSAVERDLFEALVRVRLALEPEGWAVAVQGARLDVYPSPQGRRVRGAEHVYPVDPAASPIRSVMIFDDADVSGLATVEEQAAHWEAYVGGHRGRVRQVKGEREVKVARHGDVYPARVRWWLTDDYFAGVDLVGPFGAQQAIENDTFEALVTIRRRIEPDGWRVAVQGARLDTYPSGMQRDGGVGERIYITRMGEPARETVAMFDPIDPALAVTVDEQFGHWRRWLGSSRRGRA